MSKPLRDVAVALGLTTIWVAWLVEPLVKGDHEAVLHWSGSASLLFGPVLLDVAIVWAVFTALLLSAEAGGRWRVVVWAGVWASLPWIVFRNLMVRWPTLVPHWLHLPRVYIWVLLWLLVILLWRPTVAKRYETAIDLSATVLVFVAISGAFFLTELGWFFWQAHSLNDPLPLHHEARMTAAHDSRPRIIWIVLDELSYQQVYGHRYAGLELPAFDALAKQATVFTQVVPAGKYTERAIPSMMSGTFFDVLRTSADGRFWLHNRKTDRWQPFQQHNTVFQDALNMNYSTAVAGWWNPYCRLLPAVLDRCYWSDLYYLHSGSADETFGTNALGPAAVLLGNGSLYHLASHVFRVPDLGALQTRVHISDYENLSAAGDKLLRDPSVGFALIHVPIPHPRGIYDRETGQMTAKPTTYIDNLALADKYVAHVRRLLEQTGQGDSSTVVIMGDHSWRTTFVWESDPMWTPEAERASQGGKFDPRPGYIVKLAGQKTGAKIDLPFQAVKTRALMDALMAGRIRTTDDLQAWVQQSLQPDGVRQGISRRSVASLRDVNIPMPR